MSNSKKSPLTSKPLRYAGQSVDEEIQKIMDDKVTWYALVTFAPVVLAVTEWYRWYMEIPYSPWTYTCFAVVCAIYGIYKLFKVRKVIQNLKLGRDGEKAVGQYLELLRESGSKVFHDVIGNGFNVDHVVISTKGIFTVETKTYSKPAKGKAVIQHHSTGLKINGFESKSNILVQAHAEANWLKALLKDISGKSHQVKPVIVFPGWYIENKENLKDVWVLNPKALPTYIENSPEQLSAEQVSSLSYFLSQYIRNNES